MSYVPNKGYSNRDLLREKIRKNLDIYEELIQWSPEDYREYNEILSSLKEDLPDETTKQKGDKLENLISCIIKNSYFFESYQNIRTSTNEIDCIITLSDSGKQALTQFGLNRELIPIPVDTFIGECKNYRSTLGVTYVGKFYSVLTACDFNFGILFTVKGLTGKESEFRDAYGLLHIIKMTEKYKNNRKFNILVFTMRDYELIANGESNFFDLIKTKLIAYKTSSSYEQFLNNQKHPSESQIKEIVNNLS